MNAQFIQDFYDDFLYDCYVVNKRLTDEDWERQGKEKHHIELPERDGGVLTPLNSQFLTAYQHWKAGVMQSEILGKCCFACVPKGELPPLLEALRDKWQKEHAKERYAQTGHKINNAGKMWINNGSKNRMIPKNEPVPTGWVQGRLPFSERHRANIGNSGRGRVISEETRSKLRARPNVWAGRTHTEESKEKMRQAKRQQNRND